MQLEHPEKGLLGQIGGAGAGSNPMILVAGGLSQKSRAPMDNSKNPSTTGGWTNGVASGLEYRHSQVK